MLKETDIYIVIAIIVHLTLAKDYYIILARNKLRVSCMQNYIKHEVFGVYNGRVVDSKRETHGYMSYINRCKVWSRVPEEVTRGVTSELR